MDDKVVNHQGRCKRNVEGGKGGLCILELTTLRVSTAYILIIPWR